MSRNRRIAAAALVIGVIGCVALWLVADRVHSGGDRMLGYWIGVAGSALPASALGLCWLRFRSRPADGRPAPVPWLGPVLILSLLVLGIMLVFPLL